MSNITQPTHAQTHYMNNHKCRIIEKTVNDRYVLQSILSHSVPVDALVLRV